ncbi:MAG: hypothetical protein ABIQ93_10600 [Saprospiraceae bacterium]
MTTSGPRFYIPALLSVVAFFGLVFLYVREFGVLSNTIHAGRLIAGSIVAMLFLNGALLWWFQDRFSPLSRHITEIVLIVVFSTLFAPLFVSLINRGLGKTEFQAFVFLAETPYIATGYGFMKNTSIKPTGYYLEVEDRDGQRRRFRYKKQKYYPITQAGQTVLLPVRKGLFGIRVMALD